MPGGARVMKPDQAEHLFIENYRNDEQRSGTETLRKKTHFMIQFRRGRVIKSDGPLHVEILGKCRDIDRDARIQARRHAFGCAPLVTDAKLALSG